MQNRYIHLTIFLVLFSQVITPVFSQDTTRLDAVLKQKYPADQRFGDRWAYFPAAADIRKIDKPLINAVFAPAVFYSAVLTNYLGYHINQARCILVFDSARDSVVLIPPIWYDDMGDFLIRKLLHHPFPSNEVLINTLKELHEIRETGSGFHFYLTEATDTLIRYDLAAANNFNQSTSGPGITNTISYDKGKVWRKITVQISDSAITRYTSLNPANNSSDIIE